MQAHDIDRRNFLRTAAIGAASAATLTAVPPVIAKALATPAHNASRSIRDVKHVVILMQENRSFDHYFGMLKGVRGFGDRFPIPLESGKTVWYQSNGTREVTPFHLNPEMMNSALIISTPHNFPDAQAAWAQGKFGFWAKYKTDISMGYHQRDGAPFQWALADAFTLCDAYHCSIQTGTDPNRIAFWSGSNHDPKRRDRGLDSDQSNAEVVNLRCWITGTAPTPGYTYYGSSFTWKSIPEVLQDEGVSWRIYQDVNDNWTGAMNGSLAFQGFREAQPDSPIYKNGLTTWTLDDLKGDVINGTLPSVSWICPSQLQSEHPGAPASPERGGFFTQQVLEALTASDDTWSKTVLFITFDENDGLFDHVPPPAIPSINRDGTLAGKSTVDVKGLYFKDPGVPYEDELFKRFGLPPASLTYPLIDPHDTVSGPRRPWGMGPRVPMYVVSPWSRGGWVDSQVFDHTSVGMFIEKRFGVTITAISDWHRAVAGDLTSAFNFVTPNDPSVPTLPDQSNYLAIETASKARPAAAAPAIATLPQPERGVRPSRALPYELHVSCQVDDDDNGKWRRGGRPEVILEFQNDGRAGAVFHVYDKLDLTAIPRRYTVESRRRLVDSWDCASDGSYDLWVLGPNGFHRHFSGDASPAANTRRRRWPDRGAEPEVEVSYDEREAQVLVTLINRGREPCTFSIEANAYRRFPPISARVVARSRTRISLPVRESARWYDFTATVVGLAGFERRFAGRIENGEASFSDPAMGQG